MADSTKAASDLQMLEQEPRSVLDDLRDIIASAIWQVAKREENQEFIQRCSAYTEERSWILSTEIEKLMDNIAQELFPLYRSLTNMLTKQRILITEGLERCQSEAGKLTECRAFEDIWNEELMRQMPDFCRIKKRLGGD